METILHVIFAAIALGVLVFIHELGHYWVALKVGMDVEVFSIGFGKPIYSWMRGKVKWQIGWLPFGGYVKIAGMELGKNEKTDIPGGFFTKKPLDRLKVAIAGPLANLILAFLIFVVIWATGGRDKPFSDYTKHIGWVDPSSDLYEKGVRPGDIIETYNGKSFEGIKDLFYAAMFTDKSVTVAGYKVNEETFEKTPFDYSVNAYQLPGAIEGMRTIGVLAPARYLIYDKLSNTLENPLPPGSPMESSGIQYGDRIVWADGSVIYSQDQLSHLINDSKSLITVQRDGKTFLARVPRVLVSELKMDNEVKQKLSDWQYLAEIKGKIASLYFIPYNLSPEGIVESSIALIDPEEQEKVAPKSPLSFELDEPLKVNDKIIAVDGNPVTSASELLKGLQSRNVVLMVQRGFAAGKEVSWKDADADFDTTAFLKRVQDLSTQVGLGKSLKQEGDLVLLNPITPKTQLNFHLTSEQKAQAAHELAAQKNAIDAISDPQKRNQLLKVFEENQKRLMLGVYLQDEEVVYNPGPHILFENVFAETWHTLVALVSGYLNPKWLSGPIGIVQVIQHGWTVGIKEALFWTAAISINLGFLNLLPIPVLDGGYILIALFEMVSGRRVKPKVLERLIVPFVVLLIGFLIFVTYYDLIRLF